MHLDHQVANEHWGVRGGGAQISGAVAQTSFLGTGGSASRTVPRGGEGGLERPLTESPQCLAGVGVPREEGAAVLAMVRD